MQRKLLEVSHLVNRQKKIPGDDETFTVKLTVVGFAAVRGSRRRKSQNQVGGKGDRAKKLLKSLRADGASSSELGAPHENVVDVAELTTTTVRITNRLVDEFATGGESNAEAQPRTDANDGFGVNLEVDGRPR